MTSMTPQPSTVALLPAQAGVTLESLVTLTDADLRAHGIVALGQRKKLLSAAAAACSAGHHPADQDQPAAPASSSCSAAAVALPSSLAACSLVQHAAAELLRSGGGGVGCGRITDFFQPVGGPRPAAPAFQAPLDGLLAAVKPRASIASFFVQGGSSVSSGAGGHTSTVPAPLASLRGRSAPVGQGAGHRNPAIKLVAFRSSLLP